MITVGDIKSIVAPYCGGLCADDPRVLEFMSVASEELIRKTKGKGTIGQFAVQSTSQTITWPREIETIEGITLNDMPLKLRGDWYEFLAAGPGIISSKRGTGTYQAIPKGTRPTSDVIENGGVNKELRVYCQFTADLTKNVLIQGLDADGLPVRTEWPASSGKRIDGRYFTLTNPYIAGTAGQFATITAVQKPVTEGWVKLVEHDTVTNVDRTLGYWLNWETRPEYRVSFIDGSIAGSTSQYIVVGKLKPRIYRSDLDWVTPDNINAMCLACKAIWCQKNDRLKESFEYMAAAKQCLDEQIDHLAGAAIREVNKNVDRNTAGKGVKNLQ